MRDALLFSGGMDSLIALRVLEARGASPTPIYVGLGHRYEQQERERALALLPNTLAITLGIGQWELPSAEIPLRNLYLAMAAVNLGFRRIWLSVQKDEMSIPDRTPLFFSMASSVLSLLAAEPVEVGTPVADMDKVEMVRWYLGRHPSQEDRQLLVRTWACYHPWRDEPCGDCPACVRRFIAMRLNEVEEPWHYKVRGAPVARAYLAKAKSGGYSPARCAHTIAALSGVADV